MKAPSISYEQFLESKINILENSGFDISENELNKYLFPFQKHIVKTALKKGRYALFEDCGLGKTIQQLEWANQVSKYTNKPVLILCPLAVSGQTIQEGKKFDIEVIKWLPEYNTFHEVPARIYITNYEQLENITVIEDFSGIVLDESSILKNFTGHYKNLIIDSFKETPYKLACTATPSPNDLNEIGNHSEFLNILDAQDMRSKWFVRDEGMNNYRLKGHAKKDFYAWISSWATMLTNPKDIGYEMEGFDLPSLNYIEKQITVSKRNNGRLFNEGHINATNFNAELRLTKLERLNEVAEIVNCSNESFIIWIKQNEEGETLRKLIPYAIEVKGSDSPEYKEEKLLGFANNEFRVLITKNKIAQFGLNYQNCHNQIFASLDFSFEGLYQSIRRSYRFGQKHQVNIYMITTDTMENVIASIRKKEKQFLEMQQEMNKNINDKSYGLLHSYEFQEYKTDNLWLMHGDSCIEIERIEDNSIDLIVFSPPFSSLFTYSNYIHDMGNNESHEAFFRQYRYLLKKLYAKLKPGRLMCCHTKNLGVYKNSSGYTGVYNFTDEHTRAVLTAFAPENDFEIQHLKRTEKDILFFLQDAADAEKLKLVNELIDVQQRINERTEEINKSGIGFKLHCDPITIWTDPVLEMQRTKTQRLLYKTVTSDSTYTGVGMSEYINIFRKWEGNEDEWEPVTNLNKMNFPLDTWQRWASGVWMDIKRTDVLNNREGTDLGDEKHIAPLQLEVIHRLVNLWSNEGETVFTPFLGIGSECYVALKNNRKAIGIELKDSYYETAIKNCRNVILNKRQAELVF